MTQMNVRDQDSTAGRSPTGPRCIALVGPFQSGKTTLLEAILARMGGLQRQGSVSAGTSVGDASAEARAHGMSTEANVATVDFLGDSYTFIDCPGSIEFAGEMAGVLPAVDAAVVICEADEKKVAQLQVILRELERRHIPHLFFLNKIEGAPHTIAEALALLQPASTLPLLSRQIPIWNNCAAVGCIDLALERAFLYQDHAPSRLVDIPGEQLGEEKLARYAMLERLADHDDRLMEQLLDEVEPSRDRIFDDLAHELRDGLAVPVLIGSALHGNGVLRLMKALRHEVPSVDETRRRFGVEASGGSVGLVLKTLHTAHAGKLSLVRVLRGSFKDGATVTLPDGETSRISGLARLIGQTAQKMAGEAVHGETIGLGRLDTARTGDMLSTGKAAVAAIPPACPPSVMALAIHARKRKDDVKLGAAIRKLVDEDPALSIDQDATLGVLILHGQGEMHLRVAAEKLSSRFAVGVETAPPPIGYRETIRRPATGVRGRHKKQSGGHGQFGDVVLDIAPRGRGEGFAFTNAIVGGVVPKQYIPSVEEGVRAYLAKGPLGFPVVDVGVTLTDGSFHTVDSSDMAFQLAARAAMVDALPRCHPVLLEPVLAVEVAVPSDATARANAIIAARRGQTLGFDAREGWAGWDVVNALIPEVEMADLIVELRSATAGVGTFQARFDHLAELSGREADRVTATRHAAA